MNQSIQTFLQSGKSSEGYDTGDHSFGHLSCVIALFGSLPGISTQALQAESNAGALLIDLDNVNFNLFSERYHVTWMVNPAPRNLGDMDEAFDSTQIHKNTEFRNIGYRAVKTISGQQMFQQTLTAAWQGTRSAFGKHHPAALLVTLDHFQIKGPVDEFLPPT